MARQRRRELYIGEIRQHGRKWRFALKRPKTGGGFDLEYKSYESENQARKARRIAVREAQRDEERTIQEAMNEYELYLREVKGNKPGSIYTTLFRLKSFFPDLGSALDRLNEAACSANYLALTRARVRNTGEQVAVDTHRNTLNVAKAFLDYCVGRSWLPKNPARPLKGFGKRRRGKEQLRIDEARKWTACALSEAKRGEVGAVAALTALLMGFRASEVLDRIARDLDDDGTLLWVTDSKTEAGKRTQEVPALLRPFLVALTRGKQGHERIFGGYRRGWVRDWVKRICRLAGVPEVTAHGMRGLHATLSLTRGISAHAVAKSLGHESFDVTKRHYLGDGALENAQQDKALGVLMGETNDRPELPN